MPRVPTQSRTRWLALGLLGVAGLVVGSDVASADEPGIQTDRPTPGSSFRCPKTRMSSTS